MPIRSVAHACSRCRARARRDCRAAAAIHRTGLPQQLVHVRVTARERTFATEAPRESARRPTPASATVSTVDACARACERRPAVRVFVDLAPRSINGFTVACRAPGRGEEALFFAIRSSYRLRVPALTRHPGQAAARRSRFRFSANLRSTARFSHEVASDLRLLRDNRRMSASFMAHAAIRRSTPRSDPNPTLREFERRPPARAPRPPASPLPPRLSDRHRDRRHPGISIELSHCTAW